MWASPSVLSTEEWNESLFHVSFCNLHRLPHIAFRNRDPKETLMADRAGAASSRSWWSERLEKLERTRERNYENQGSNKLSPQTGTKDLRALPCREDKNMSLVKKGSKFFSYLGFKATQGSSVSSNKSWLYVQTLHNLFEGHSQMVPKSRTMTIQQSEPETATSADQRTHSAACEEGPVDVLEILRCCNLLTAESTDYTPGLLSGWCFLPSVFY